MAGFGEREGNRDRDGERRRDTEKEKQESQSAIRSENPDCLKKKKEETTKPDFRWSFSYLPYIRSHTKYPVTCKSLESRGELQIGQLLRQLLLYQC